MFGVVGVHVPQERRVGAGDAGDHGAQFLGHRGVAPGAAEIEEDVAQPERRRIALAAPQGDLFLPLGQGLAPKGIGCHHITTAQRYADGVEVAGQALGQLDEPRIDFAVPVVRVVGEDETVVLVGVQEIFPAPARSHDDDAEIHRRRPVSIRVHGRESEVDEAAVYVAVDVGEQGLNFGRRQVVLEKLGGEFDLCRLDLLEAVDAVVAGEDVDLADEALRRDGQRVVQVEHPDEPAGAVHHRHVAKAVAAHARDGVVEVFVGRDGHDRRRHDVVHRRPGKCLERDAPGYVLFGDDAERPTLAVRDRGAGGVFLGEALDHPRASDPGVNRQGHPAHEILDQLAEYRRLRLHRPPLSRRLGSIVAPAPRRQISVRFHGRPSRMLRKRWSSGLGNDVR